MASAKTITYLARNDLFLVHAVKLKPIIKAQISGKLVTSGIIDSDCFSTLPENPG